MRVSLACKVQLNVTELARLVTYSGILQFCHVARHAAKTPSASFNSVRLKLAGHINLNYKVFIIEQN